MKEPEREGGPTTPEETGPAVTLAVSGPFSTMYKPYPPMASNAIQITISIRRIHTTSPHDKPLNDPPLSPPTKQGLDNHHSDHQTNKGRDHVHDIDHHHRHHPLPRLTHPNVPQIGRAHV